MSKLLQELADVSDVFNISEVKFGLLNPDALKKASVCHVVVPETYEGSEPKENGLFDPRMGVIERGRICPTDEYDHTITPGYFGHIELPCPVYWVQHMETIVKLLRCVCIRCANILIDKSNPSIMKELKKKNGANAFKWVSDQCSKQTNKRCVFNGGCNAVQPNTYRKLIGDKAKNDNIVQIEAEYSADVFKDATEKKMKFVLPVETVLNIFKRITPEDAELLGFDNQDARPEWMICTVVPVAPPAVRPSVRQDNNQRAEDDLTSKFADIVKITNALKKEMEKAMKKETDAEKESSARQINASRAYLQYHIATLVDNEIKNIPPSNRRSGQPLKMIRQRLSGKEGRIRFNIMGKRVDFSGRTVVGVDPNISIDQYGVPEKIAMNLTVPETVTKYNMTKLYKLVRNGPNVHPGARQITKMNYDENGIAHPEHIYLKYIDRESIVLEEGDVVERHLMDGDWGQFNRQPSLHRMSMMAHKVKVMPGKTFRLNVYVTAPYNADFDGDEMNTHIPQHIETAYELAELTAVSTQIITPAKSTPIIQVNNDTLIGAYLITQPHVKISKKNVLNLLMTNTKYNGILPDSKDGYYTGQDMFSMFLPDISIKKGNKSYDSDPVDKNMVIIDNGHFKQGILDKTIIGSQLIHMIYDSFGPNAVKDFLDNNQRMLNRWLSGYSFTVGFGDCVPTKDDNVKITELVESKVKDVNTLVKEANMGLYKQNLDNKFIKISLESDIMQYLQTATFDFQKYISKSINKDNSIYQLINSGTKGSNDDLSAIRGFIGQTSIMGQRVSYGYTRRTLTHFSKDDYGAKSRGFIANSYFNGMDPVEMFFHLMGGREGCIDTAIKTAQSGYMQRRLIKALEDLTVKYGGTVRNGINNIVQFAYGDDGIDPCKLNKQDLKLVEMSNVEMEKKYLVNGEDISILKSIMVPEAYKEMTSNKAYMDKFKEDYEMMIELRNYARQNYFKDMTVMNTTIFSPINFTRQIKNARDMFKIQLNKKIDLTPEYVRKSLKELHDELRKYLPEFSLNIFRDLLYTHLSPKVSLIEYRFNKTVFKYVVDTIREKYLSSIVQPGEMVGIIGAQSMGEPLTQMSVPSETKIIVEMNGKMLKTSIGEFIDSIIRTKRGKIYYEDAGRHTIMEIQDNCNIVSVSNDEKISWKKISKISRHPPNGQLMKVETSSGKITKATLSHSFLKRTPIGIEPVEGKHLKIGDRIPITQYIPEIVNPMTSVSFGVNNVELDESFGYFCAIYVCYGTITKYGIKMNRKEKVEYSDFLIERICMKNGWPVEFRETSICIKSVNLMEFISKNFGKGSENKSIEPIVYQSNLDFIKGFISGMTDIESHVDESRMTIRFGSYNREFISDLCILLSYIGIYGYILKENRRNNVINILDISRKYITDFNKKINVHNKIKNAAIDKIVAYMNRENVHDMAEYIDKIPEVGELIADVGKMLKLKDHSRIYGRWRTKESIGRRTLAKYINIFKLENTSNPEIINKIKLLEQAVNSNVVWDEITSIEYYDGADDEFVYDFTIPGTESFMVDDGIMVHNTLNSVEWNTEMLINVDGELVRTKIGEWIDSRIKNANPENIENHEHDTILEYVKDKKIFVPACTEDGKIIWDEVEAVTRHPVINKDGTNTLLKVTTANGREVIATKAKSFLKRINNKIVGVDGDSVKVGDYLPVSCDDKENYSIIPDVNLSDGLRNIVANEIQKYISESVNENDRKIFESLMMEEIVYDRVVKVEEVVSEHPWVYDLTVKQTRNFNIYNGLCMRDTFHNAGVGAKAVVTSKGVPRIQEIINVAKTIKSPSMKIYLKDEFTSDVNKAKLISNQIEFTKLQDIVDKTMIIYENPTHETNENEDLEFIQTYQEFAEMIGVSQCPEDQLSHWVLRVIFNKEKMMNKNIYLADIQDVIQRNDNENDIQCTFSDDNAKELIMRIRPREDSYDGDYLGFLQELEKILMSITIRGIPNVEKVEPEMIKRVKYNEDGSYSQSSEWYLITLGVNLLDVLMNENVDTNRTLSNDIHEINEIFGIEATRAIILRELVMDDYEVNYRHLSLLGDIMTHRGVIMPIERHGINRSAERGPIAKATFEESTEILVKASTFGEKDKMGGVSANVMFGQLPKVGTNAFDLLLDESKFLSEMKLVREREKEKKEEVKPVNSEAIESKLVNEYDENIGENIDAQFDFVFDATKNPEKQLPPHIFPDTGIEVKETPKKKKITMKKK